MVYWSALGTWRILRPLSDGSYPSRQMVNRAIARKPSRQRLQDDDGQLLVEDEPVFCSVPSPPASWQDADAQMDFRLTAPERRFLTTCLLSVTRADASASPSLLARLVEQQVAITPANVRRSPRSAAPYTQRWSSKCEPSSMGYLRRTCIDRR